MHPLVRGHIEIIPRRHVFCVGALMADELEEFERLYQHVVEFLSRTYGSCAAFEHGITGQTVFHCHVHLLPFAGAIERIVPESQMRPIFAFDEIVEEFKRSGKYLFVEVDGRRWLVDTSLGYPRIFRDRFAHALNAQRRADWRRTESDKELMVAFQEDMVDLEKKWKGFHVKNK
jgi:diadenosine tetraphosphate (Ap4A) HIT family hydrolase